MKASSRLIAVLGGVFIPTYIFMIYSGGVWNIVAPFVGVIFILLVFGLMLLDGIFRRLSEDELNVLHPEQKSIYDYID